MKTGASSMWASCCGLLNDVMGTGAVRGQQAGFGAGAGPFRFAPSAGYSTYPPSSSGSPSPLCKACGQAFSVFRRKYMCTDCRKGFCSVCSELQDNLRLCSVCRLLRATAFQRPRLMRLRVRELRQYLLLRNVSTETCREKEDLVELVLCHHGNQDEDAGSPSPSAVRSPASQGQPISRSDSSDTNQDSGDATSVSLLNLDAGERTPEVSPPTRRRASLSDVSSLRDVEDLSVRQLKEILARNFVNYSGCCEKWELVERVGRLYRETQDNRRSRENVSSTVTSDVAPPPPLCNGAVADGEKSPLELHDDGLCRICMDGVIDCVLLECGHMVTCTKCGKRMNECPICRQYVVRAVHVFKS
ncbi:E3 ubiquitin-protein ligase RNF34a isoform X1 [Sander lucioperca]|uniref:RING-type E3 ubiquitin transferase n=1 Tax=Sander lucioperca TaxID=283035 RepID=A0A8C9Y333_SANLU|nr:E3 ubiquitin-protein ligase RNF34a isoform X1 [Sander lucioperca]